MKNRNISEFLFDYGLNQNDKEVVHALASFIFDSYGCNVNEIGEKEELMFFEALRMFIVNLKTSLKSYGRRKEQFRAKRREWLLEYQPEYDSDHVTSVTHEYFTMAMLCAALTKARYTVTTTTTSVNIICSQNYISQPICNILIS